MMLPKVAAWFNQPLSESPTFFPGPYGIYNCLSFCGCDSDWRRSSLLPNFKDLAKQVGANSGIEQSAHEPEDRYLGRLRQSGIQVHKAVARILTHSESQPNDLHRLRLEIATTSPHVRIVTADFDSHFLTAASQLFEDGLQTFFAPALPLGNGSQTGHGNAASWYFHEQSSAVSVPQERTRQNVSPESTGLSFVLS